MPKHAQVVPYDTSDEALRRAFGQMVAKLAEKDDWAKVEQIARVVQASTVTDLDLRLIEAMVRADVNVKRCPLMPMLEAREADKAARLVFKVEQSKTKQRERYEQKKAKEEEQRRTDLLCSAFDAMNEENTES